MESHLQLNTDMNLSLFDWYKNFSSLYSKTKDGAAYKTIGIG